MRKAMIVPRLIILVASAAVASIALVVVVSGNLALAASSVVNGNFETGDLTTGWSVDTTNGGTASAVKSYDYSYQRDCTPEEQYGSLCYDTATVPPHEGSYFASLKSGKPSWNSPTPTDTKISQPFKASAGDKISGWAFFQTDNYLNQGWWDPSQSQSQDGWTYSSCPNITGFTWTDWTQCRDKGEVLITSDSGTKVVATPWVESVRNSEWQSREYSGWKYWEYTLPAGTVEGDFQIEARVGSVVYYGASAIGLDDVKTGPNDAPWGNDATKPSSSATRSVQPNAAGWNKEDVTVQFKATDNEGGSGVRDITYRINGGEPTTKPGYLVEVPVTDEGENTIAYYATDKAGNVEDEQSLQVKIDKTPPKIDFDSRGPADNATGVSPTAKISVRFLESGSGIKPSTLTDGFQVFKVTSGSGDYVSVSGKVSYDASSKAATFTPSRRLAKGETYVAVIHEYVTDKADNWLGIYEAWSFSVT